MLADTARTGTLAILASAMLMTPLAARGEEARPVAGDVVRAAVERVIAGVQPLAGTVSGSAAASSPRFSFWALDGAETQPPSLRPAGRPGALAGVTVGADYTFADTLAIGLSVAHDAVGLDPFLPAYGMQADAYTVAPYVALGLGPHVTLSGVGGYAGMDAAAGLAGQAASPYEAERLFGAVTLSATYALDRLQFGGMLGYLYMGDGRERLDQGAAAGESGLGQGRAGLRIGYDLGGITPYLMGRLDRELAPRAALLGAPEGEIDATGYVVGLGLDFAFDGISGGIQANSADGGDVFGNYAILGNIRLRF